MEWILNVHWEISSPFRDLRMTCYEEHKLRRVVLVKNLLIWERWFVLEEHTHIVFFQAALGKSTSIAYCGKSPKKICLVKPGILPRLTPNTRENPLNTSAPNWCIKYFAPKYNQDWLWYTLKVRIYPLERLLVEITFFRRVSNPMTNCLSLMVSNQPYCFRLHNKSK